jgi:pyruvate/2-oxoglutarate dehydrogenase complex dihydrolipoamide acyltransferase (E2) component
LQAQDEVKEPQEEIQDAAMAKESDMTPRLQFWYGNSKDRTSIEWWCDVVDRIKDQKGWNNDQGKKSAASVAVDALREDAIDVHHSKGSSGGGGQGLVADETAPHKEILDHQNIHAAGKAVRYTHPEIGGAGGELLQQDPDGNDLSLISLFYFVLYIKMFIDEAAYAE